MKNKKIIAMLCVMAMLMTTLSSIFVVTAAEGPILKISVDEPDDKGEALVTVSYEGFPEGTNVGVVQVQIPIEGAEYVDKSVSGKLANMQTGFDKGVLKVGTATTDYFGKEAVIATFKIQNITSSTPFATQNTYITTYVDEDDLDGTSYGKGNNVLNIVSDDLPYVEQQGDRNAINMKSVANTNGTKTVTVSYDMTNANIPDIKVGVVEFTIELTGTLDSNTISGIKSVIANGQYKYDPDLKTIKYGTAVTDYVTGNVNDICTFNVAAGVDLTLKISSAKITTYVDEDDLDGTAYTMAKNQIFSPTLRIKAKEDDTPTTDTPTTDTPTTDTPATETPTLAPTAEPKPVVIPEKVVTTVSVPNLGGEGSASMKAFNINLGEISVADASKLANVKDVMIAMQGYKIDGDKKIPVGFVSVIVSASALGKTGNVQGNISGANVIAVNIVDADHPENILASRVENKVE